MMATTIMISTSVNPPFRMCLLDFICLCFLLSGGTSRQAGYDIL